MLCFLAAEIMAYVLKLLLFLSILSCTVCKKAPENDKPEWAKKDITDYTDVDLERLLDQWEVSISQFERRF